jgi:hypothetical protein
VQIKSYIEFSHFFLIHLHAKIASKRNCENNIVLQWSSHTYPQEYCQVTEAAIFQLVGIVYTEINSLNLNNLKG